MKTKIITCGVILSFLPVICANADTAITTGNQSPAIVGNHATVNYGISDATLQKILAQYEKQQKVDAEQIKQYQQMLEDLRSGKIDAPPSAIQAAFAALEKGDSSLAETLFEKSVAEELKKSAESNKQAAKALRNLGTLRWWDSQKAIAAYSQATKLDPDNADGWNQLGHLYRRIGELDNAIAAYQTVLKLGQAHQEQLEIAVAYGNLGLVYYTRGELDKAVEMHNKALELNQALGSKEGMAANYGNLGIVYKTRGELDKAVEMYQKSLAITESLGDKTNMAAAYGNLGNVYQKHGDFDKAVKMYQKSLVINQKLGKKEGVAENYNNLGIVYKMRGELEKAVDMHSKALALNEALGSKEGMARDYSNFGSVYKQKGNNTEAKRYWQKSIELYKYLKSPNEKLVQGWLDDLK